MNRIRPFPIRAARDSGARHFFRTAAAAACLIFGVAWLAIPAPAVQLPVTKSFFPVKSLPLPKGGFVSLDTAAVSYGDSVQMRDVRLRWSGNPAESVPPPLLGSAEWRQWTGTLSAEVSTDGGASWVSCAGDCEVVQRVAHPQDGTGGEQYETLTRLKGAIGPNATWLMVHTRESMPNAGQSTVQPVAGGFMIDSFFDIWVKISVDGGSSWMPGATPHRLAVKADHSPALPVVAPGVLLPSPCDEYQMRSDDAVTLPGGIVIRRAHHKLFGASIVPPTPGAGSVGHTFDSQPDFQISTDGGASFLTLGSPAGTRVEVRRLTLGSEEFYDAEITRLDVSGGGLPLGLMIRESPTT